MAIYLRHVDFEQGLSKRGNDVIFLNDLDPIADSELCNKLTVTQYDGPTFSMMPSCNCGETTLAKYPEKKIGDVCEFCHTKIAVQSNRPLEPTVWMEAPEGIRGFINPSFLGKMLAAFKITGKSSTIIHWLLDPSDKTCENIPALAEPINYLLSYGVRRGINFFIDNADMIFKLLDNDKVFTTHYAERSQLIKLYQRDKAILFPRCLPLTDKSFSVIEKSHLGTYADYASLTPYTNLINTFMSIQHKKRLSQSKKESIIFKVLCEMVDYYATYIKTHHNKKMGDWRKHVYGSRLPWTLRTVISSIHEPHDIGEIHLSWSAAIPVLEVHLTNFMLKKRMTPNEIRRRILYAVNNYDPEIHEMINYLIKTSPHKTKLSGKPGLMILDNRNPSLKMGNLKSCIVTKVKTDVSDITCSLSVLALGSFNADFDGDEMNKMLVIDGYQAASLSHLSDSTTVLSHAEPNKLSGDVSLPKQCWAMIGNWVEEYAEGYPWQA